MVRAESKDGCRTGAVLEKGGGSGWRDDEVGLVRVHGEDMAGGV